MEPTSVYFVLSTPEIPCTVCRRRLELFWEGGKVVGQVYCDIQKPAT